MAEDEGTTTTEVDFGEHDPQQLAYMDGWEVATGYRRTCLAGLFEGASEANPEWFVKGYKDAKLGGNRAYDEYWKRYFGVEFAAWLRSINKPYEEWIHEQRTAAEAARTRRAARVTSNEPQLGGYCW